MHAFVRSSVLSITVINNVVTNLTRAPEVSVRAYLKNVTTAWSLSWYIVDSDGGGGVFRSFTLVKIAIPACKITPLQASFKVSELSLDYYY